MAAAKRGRKRWIIAFVHIPSPDNFEETLHQVADIPMLHITQTSYSKGEKASFEVLSDNPQISVENDKSQPLSIITTAVAPKRVKVECILPEKGLYTIKIKDGNKITEGILTAHPTWKWTLEQARKAALKYHQKATSHIESWYGFHSAFLAARYFPEKSLDVPLRQRFDYLFGLLHDSTKMEPKYYASRIQNTSGTIGMLVDKYQAYKDIHDLNTAGRLVNREMAKGRRSLRQS